MNINCYDDKGSTKEDEEGGSIPVGTHSSLDYSEVAR